MLYEIRISDFDPRYQAPASNLINVGLGDHFGFIDESMNPDLYDISSHYRDGVFLLALDGNHLVGTGSLMPADNGEGQIARMHTESTYRRTGVATKLLSHLEERAMVRGIRRITLETCIDWNDAIGFYLSNGYAEIDRNDDDIWFAKVLDTATR